MNLVLEIEYMLGVGFAARDQASDIPDWPPQPDRIFSALLASWGARGERENERRALQWLETQTPPEIVASGGHARTAPVVFVPPNDAESGRVGNPAVLPSMRRRQARRFPAFRPENPVVSLIWRQADPDADVLAALNVIAADTAYIGHSASLTRCQFRIDGAAKAGGLPRRSVYRGRLAELERDFHARPLRRPRPGIALRNGSDNNARDNALGAFSDRWLILEHVDGEMPDIRATALVAKALRDAVMSGYRQIGLGDVIPPEVSGHSPDGSPSSQPHLAITPLAFLGRPHASGAVLGFALIPPHRRNLLGEIDFQRAVRAVLHWNEMEERREMRLAPPDITFAPAGVAGRRSLDPAPYVAEARVWASCTPIVLDRHLKETTNAAREAEIEGLIQQACVNIGLQPPVRVIASKHSGIAGAPSAYPSGPAPRWLRWRLPKSLASRQLIHAVVEFKDQVSGPVILGAGRFVGLGLCRALQAGGAR